jgi:pimeloyl-ACP methyl ester carboxylesterase
MSRPPADRPNADSPPVDGAPSDRTPAAATLATERLPAPGVPRLLPHGRAELALHLVRAAIAPRGRPLLLLHGLGERTPARLPAHLAAWPGPIVGLDFTGHGASTVPRGGGYTAEILMADTDTALRHLGEVTLLGRGLGAYVALLAAGARPDLVHGAILCDGPGLVGGGIRPGSPSILRLDPASMVEPDGTPARPDPYALAELSRDVRPPDYAAAWVRHANEYGSLDSPIAVTTVVRPEWIEAVVAVPGVVDCSMAEALTLFAYS